jgi:hypothetical protein
VRLLARGLDAAVCPQEPQRMVISDRSVRALDVTRAAPLGKRRHATNAFGLVLMVLLAQDALPGASEGRQAIRRVFAPLLYPLGLFQGDWKLFAPEPDRVNTWIEARVTFSNGQTTVWTSPDWRNLSWHEELLRGRHAKWWDVLRRDEFKVLWPSFALHVAGEVPRPSPDATPVEVALVRHWWDVPPPDLAADTRVFPIPPRREFPHAFVYHTERLP